MDIPFSHLKISSDLKINVDFLVNNEDINEDYKQSDTSLNRRNDGVLAYTLDELLDKIVYARAEQGIECNQLVTLDQDFIKVFLLTYQSFTDFDTLVENLFLRYSVLNDQKKGWAEFENYRKPIQLRIGNFIIHWVKKYPFDFTSSLNRSRNIILLQNFIVDIIHLDHPTMAKQILKYLKKLKIVKKPKLIAKINLESDGDDAQHIFSLSAEEIAEQLTLIEFNLFSAVVV